mmetsp:Transcript_21234/g.36471  ORF Transcript_21234/g.36471 Transcript_21234/m.36471 type:complete len:180 (-) Transcript_21234:549-1088(-)
MDRESTVLAESRKSFDVITTAKKRKARVLAHGNHEATQKLLDPMSRLQFQVFLPQRDQDGCGDQSFNMDLRHWYEPNLQHEETEEDEWRCKRRKISRQASARIRQACNALFSEIASRHESFVELSGRLCSSPSAPDTAPVVDPANDVSFAHVPNSSDFLLNTPKSLNQSHTNTARATVR